MCVYQLNQSLFSCCCLWSFHDASVVPLHMKHCSILVRIMFLFFFLCQSQLLRFFSWVLPVLYKSRLLCHQNTLPFMLRDFNIQEWQAHRVKCVKTPMANFLVTVKLNIVRECAQSQGRPGGLDFFPCCQLTCWQLHIYAQAEMEMAPDSHSFLALFLFFVIYLYLHVSPNVLVQIR